MKSLFSLGWLLITSTILFAQTPTEVVFRVGANSQISWFDINTPSINGTMDISTNAFFGTTGALNAALWDPVKIRLVFAELNSSPNRWYSIDMNGQPLVTGGSVNVTSKLSFIGNPTIGTAGNVTVPQGGYRPSTLGYYVLEANTDRTWLMNQNVSGSIVSSTLFGNLNGGTPPTTVSGGDLDFSAADKLWMTGGEAGSTFLARFGTGAGLPLEFSVTTTALFNGITFDSTRTTLYGYQATTQQYGILDQTTGAFTLLSTDPIFAGPGDLTSGALYSSFAVPEPATWVGLGLAVLGTLGYGIYRWRTNHLIEGREVEGIES